MARSPSRGAGSLPSFAVHVHVVETIWREISPSRRVLSPGPRSASLLPSRRRSDAVFTSRQVGGACVAVWELGETVERRVFFAACFVRLRRVFIVVRRQQGATFGKKGGPFRPLSPPPKLSQRLLSNKNLFTGKGAVSRARCSRANKHEDCDALVLFSSSCSRADADKAFF